MEGVEFPADQMTYVFGGSWPLVLKQTNLGEVQDKSQLNYSLQWMLAKVEDDDDDVVKQLLWKPLWEHGTLLEIVENTWQILAVIKLN